MDGDQPSASRLISAVCTAFSIIWISHIVFTKHVIPDGTALAGLTAFGTAHYAANKAAAVFQK